MAFFVSVRLTFILREVLRQERNPALQRTDYSTLKLSPVTVLQQRRRVLLTGSTAIKNRKRSWSFRMTCCRVQIWALSSISPGVLHLGRSPSLSFSLSILLCCIHTCKHMQTQTILMTSIDRASPFKLSAHCWQWASCSRPLLWNTFFPSDANPPGPILFCIPAPGKQQHFCATQYIPLHFWQITYNNSTSWNRGPWGQPQGTNKFRHLNMQPREFCSFGTVLFFTGLIFI